MIPTELLRRIRRIEITTSRLASELLAGQYHSAFKGRGIEFDEVRLYQPGDDVRAIDWNVTARAGAPHIKVFKEDRLLTLLRNNICCPVITAPSIREQALIKRRR